VGKKKASQKEEKGFTEAFSAAHHFELPGSLPSDAHWILVHNGAPVAAQNTIALARTLCLSRTLSRFLNLFLSFFFWPLVLFVGVFFGRFSFSFFW
jgi:hypothetical protein